MRKYQMFNGFCDRIFDSTTIIEANSGSEACKKLLDKIGVKFTKIVRSAGNNVKIKAEPFIEKDGKKYRNGVASWFEVWNNDSPYA